MILGFQMAKHVPKRLKITLTKGQKMCRNTASCLNSYGTIQYARLKKQLVLLKDTQIHRRQEQTSNLT